MMQLSKLAIDTGYEAPAVYAWSRAVGYAQATPIKGVESFNRSTPVSGPTFVDATIGGKRLRWAKGQPETAAYYCEGCERPIAEHHKTRMLEAGEWRATAISVDPHSIGFHISAL